MESHSVANKRILKNTVLLYIRLIISSLISLYTSRIVLKELGAEDFGVYNVVAGFITLIAVVNGSMVSATRRFLTVSIAKDNVVEQRITFSTCFYVHLFIAIIVLLFSYTVGYWFIENKMIIPEDRLSVAYRVFDFSIISILSLILTVPHNALVVAYENMGTFSYLSLLDVFIKLLVVLYLPYTSFDKLYVYALFICLSSVFVRLLYVIYCHLKYIDVSYAIPKNYTLIKSMFSFAGWNMFSSVANSGYQHGVNILLNMFLGPIVNAARSISAQVYGTVNMLAVNFQQAVNPQITKNYVYNDTDRLKQLLYV